MPSGDKREQDRSREGVCALDLGLDLERGLRDDLRETGVVEGKAAGAESTPSSNRKTGFNFSSSALALGGGAFGPAS